MMFGYASMESKELMPMPILLAHIGSLSAWTKPGKRKFSRFCGPDGNLK